MSQIQLNMPPPPPTNPSNHGAVEYDLHMRQEPKQARMCGVGGKADRRPIDPPPIIQLIVRPAKGSNPTSQESGLGFLQNPYYFMFASLAKPDDDTELHWLKDGRTRCTQGSVVSSLYHLKDKNNDDVGYFVFPDVSVRTEGSYRLKLSLFEVAGNVVRHCKSIFSKPFYVYTAKKFPGMEQESTELSCSLADQGIKIRIRKDIRIRHGTKEPDRKRQRHNDTDERGQSQALIPGSGSLLAAAPPISGTSSMQSPAQLTIPPPPGAQTIPPPPGAAQTIPPPPGAQTIPPPPGAQVIPPPPGATQEYSTPPPATPTSAASSAGPVQVPAIHPAMPPQLHPSGPPPPQDPYYHHYDHYYPSMWHYPPHYLPPPGSLEGYHGAPPAAPGQRPPGTMYPPPPHPYYYPPHPHPPPHSHPAWGTPPGPGWVPPPGDYAPPPPRAEYPQMQPRDYAPLPSRDYGQPSRPAEYTSSRGSEYAQPPRPEYGAPPRNDYVARDYAPQQRDYAPPSMHDQASHQHIRPPPGAQRIGGVEEAYAAPLMRDSYTQPLQREYSSLSRDYHQARSDYPPPREYSPPPTSSSRARDYITPISSHRTSSDYGRASGYPNTASTASFPSASSSGPFSSTVAYGGPAPSSSASFPTSTAATSSTFPPVSDYPTSPVTLGNKLSIGNILRKERD